MQKKFQAYILNQSSNFCGLIIFLKLNLALPAAHTFLLLQQMLSNLQTEPLSPIPSAPSISSLSSAPLSPSSHDSASNTSPPPDWNIVNGQFHQIQPPESSSLPLSPIHHRRHSQPRSPLPISRQSSAQELATAVGADVTNI